MKTVYIESSVISYLTARTSRDIVTSARQTLTMEWWDKERPKYQVFISELVLEEISSGDQAAAQKRCEIVDGVQVLEATAYANELAKTLVAHGAVPTSSVEDAMHIGIATAQGIDYLLTWNFKHINNAATRDKISTLIAEQGYICPVLCSPEELTDAR